jgi:two-component system, response regulator
LKAKSRCLAVPQRPLVLWAEDNPQDQILIRATLEDLPRAPDVRFSDDGVLLLEALQGSKPALVVLDLKMPRLGGLETLRRIRSEPALASLPVSVFSAGDHPEETAACQRLGALEVVRKPVDFREFTAAVHAIVAKARL